MPCHNPGVIIIRNIAGQAFQASLCGFQAGMTEHAADGIQRYFLHHRLRGERVAAFFIQRTPGAF